MPRRTITNGRMPPAYVGLPQGSSCEPRLLVEFDPEDLALIIDALLKAERILPLIDERYQAMAPVVSIRLHQLALATRLEDLLAEAGIGSPGIAM